MTLGATLAVAVTIALGAVGSVRWLRVAQREHYLPGTVSRFWLRWARRDVLQSAIVAAGAAALVAAALVDPLLAIGAGVAAVAFPTRLGLRGRTSPLAWTRRLRVVAAVTAAIAVLLVAVAALGGGTAAAVAAGAAALGSAVLVDGSLAATAPFERRAARRWIDRAASRLDEIDPVRVAITGSYGKTTTKGFARHLVEGHTSVLASPASFNNAGGLSRTVNEHLAPGTEVLIAEMGTYGPGEIRALCEWVRPQVAAICAIGPVHLERMRTLDTVVEAKSEILERAEIGVLNVDAHGLAAVADRAQERGLDVIRVSAGAHPDADVVASPTPCGLRVSVRGEEVATVAGLDAEPGNVACAVGIALALDVPLDHVARRLHGLPRAAHRREVTVAPSGVQVIDDTFNSNPAGCAAALDTLGGLAAGRRVVVTPGMVELGPVQAAENERFAAHAAEVADDVVLVARTNRDALRRGAGRGRAAVVEVDTREEAVAWVRATLAAGDAVLYENDLPDHYP